MKLETIKNLFTIYGDKLLSDGNKVEDLLVEGLLRELGYDKVFIRGVDRVNDRNICHTISIDGDKRMAVVGVPTLNNPDSAKKVKDAKSEAQSEGYCLLLIITGEKAYAMSLVENLSDGKKVYDRTKQVGEFSYTEEDDDNTFEKLSNATFAYYIRNDQSEDSGSIINALNAELRKKDEEIESLRNRVSELENKLAEKNESSVNAGIMKRLSDSEVKVNELQDKVQSLRAELAQYEVPSEIKQHEQFADLVIGHTNVKSTRRNGKKVEYLGIINNMVVRESDPAKFVGKVLTASYNVAGSKILRDVFDGGNFSMRVAEEFEEYHAKLSSQGYIIQNEDSIDLIDRVDKMISSYREILFKYIKVEASEELEESKESGEENRSKKRVSQGMDVYNDEQLINMTLQESLENIWDEGITINNISAILRGTSTYEISDFIEDADNRLNEVASKAMCAMLSISDDIFNVVQNVKNLEWESITDLLGKDRSEGSYKVPLLNLYIKPFKDIRAIVPILVAMANTMEIELDEVHIVYRAVLGDKLGEYIIGKRDIVRTVTQDYDEVGGKEIEIAIEGSMLSTVLITGGSYKAQNDVVSELIGVRGTNIEKMDIRKIEGKLELYKRILDDAIGNKIILNGKFEQALGKAIGTNDYILKMGDCEDGDRFEIELSDGNKAGILQMSSVQWIYAIMTLYRIIYKSTGISILIRINTQAYEYYKKYVTTEPTKMLGIKTFTGYIAKMINMKRSGGK